MSNLSERIKYFTEKMNVRFAKTHIVHLQQMTDEIVRVLKKEIVGERAADFTAQDLRSLIMVVEKTFKAINKEMSFVQFQKKLLKHDKITCDVFKKEAIELGKIARLAKDLEIIFCELNYYATFLCCIELQYEQIKEKDQKILQQELEYLAMEILR